MRYNIHFCILSAAYLLITAFFYRRQARVPSRRNTLFDAMLWCGIISLALDIAAAVIDHYAALWPAWMIYAINITFLLSIQASGVLFFYYAINLAGAYRRLRKGVRMLILLPFATAAALILLSPFFRGGAFYLDGGNVYHHGATHLALYVSMAFYLFGALVVVFLRRKKLRMLKFHTILAFLAVSAAAMLLQLNYPNLLVNTTANAFALILMYHILEAPGTHVDALTGVLNRTALAPLLHESIDEGGRCTLLVYTLDTLHLVNHSFGMRGGDAALIAFAGYLKRAYLGQNVLRTEGDIFSVLFTGGAYFDQARLADVHARTRSAFSLNGAAVTLDTSLACINSEDCATAEEMTALLESVMRLHRDGKMGPLLLADAAFKRALLQTKAIEEATQRALDEDRVEVYYQPIHDAEGRLCALEALVRIQDPELGFLPPQELVELAERNGSILRLGEQVLRRTCAFVRDNDVAAWGLHHVGVNLSALQCVRGELEGEIERAFAEYGVDARLIAFEVTETAAGAHTAVRENMERLSAKGIHFLLDDFGTGYANFKNMAALPFRCIKIDKSLLWNAQESPGRMRLLTGVVKIIRTLGLTSLCEGVETAEQAALLRALGVAMLQGYFYSKPLPPARMVEYAKKEGRC